MSHVQSVQRALAILEQLARGPAGVSELAKATELPKSTVARLLSTLEAQEAVDRPPESTDYRLGRRSPIWPPPPGPIGGSSQ